jgi:peptidoglycan/xylan/chitin deacetylase (PgdA/CDA1 family)
MILLKLVALVAKIFPDAVFYKPTTEKVVALTIDDIPTPNEPDDRSTQLILDAIEEFNQKSQSSQEKIRATFFVITNHLTENSTIIEKILQQGHEIGNHGLRDETAAFLSETEFARQLEITDTKLFQLSQQQIQWYRPGRGLYNRRMLQILYQNAKYQPRIALASLLPLDTFSLTSNPKFTAWYVSEFIFPGAILLLHGGSRQRSENTAIALKAIIHNLKKQNYRIVTLSELIEVRQSKT